MKNTRTDTLLRVGIGLLLTAMSVAIYAGIHERVVMAGDSAPRFTIKADNGRTVTLPNFGGKVLVLNFWATWCPPCVEEMPMLDAFSQQQSGKGWQVIGLAIDQPSSVRQFLARTPVRYPIGLAGLEGTGLVRELGNTSGGLPFTVLLGPDGTLRQRRMGRLSRADLDAWTAG